MAGFIQFCDVGHGDCTIIGTDSGKRVLIDCYGIEKYASLLPKNKLIEAVFITHPHDDHFGGLSFLRNNKYKIKRLIHSPYVRRHNDASVELPEWNRFRSHAVAYANSGTIIHQPFRQQNVKNVFFKCDGVSYRILGPHEHIANRDKRHVHDACLVVHVSAGTRKFLICGDASDLNLAEVASKTNNLCGDVLRASHHGSLQGADLSFIKKANPKYTLISTKVGTFESVPHPTAMSRYQNNTRVSVFRTDLNGSRKWTF